MFKKLTAIVAVVAMLAVASPASAHYRPRPTPPSPDVNVNVDVDNSAVVRNNVTTSANTGRNDADGGRAGSRAASLGFWSNANSDANGGEGGSITTGNAKATSVVENHVNYNEVDVRSSCGCAGDVNVRASLNNYNANVGNTVTTRANSGRNDADGGRAWSKAWAVGIGADSTSDADGGDAGTVRTGTATSLSSALNVVNSNVVRVRR